MNNKFKEIEEMHEVDVYPKRGITLVKGKGALVWDIEGKEYIDCVAGQGSVNIGHCNQDVIFAVQAQMENMMSCVEIFHNDCRANLLEKLSRITGLNRSFLCSTGAEAVETAMKFARVSTGRKKIVAFMKAFHGRTLGALSCTWKKEYREPFMPLIPEVYHIPFNNIERLRELIDDSTAGVIVEPIQGEGGVNPGSDEFLLGVQELCAKTGALFILDEIQTGFGRTGKMFAFEHWNLLPDMVCVAKSMGGGLPIGAVVCNDKIKIGKMQHGSTFGGNPVMCAAAIAAISFIEDNKLCDKSRELGEYFISKLKEINSPLIVEVRGKGLMVGVELTEKPMPYLMKLMENGVLAMPAGNTVLRFLPPLVISKEQIDFVVEKVEKVLTDGKIL